MSQTAKNIVMLEEMKALAPWHFNVKVNSHLKTSHANCGDHEGYTFVNPYELMGLIKSIYPDGLAGKRFLDAACNSGAYCFVARNRGAEEIFGFDVRELWIKQANYLKACLPGRTDNIHFEQCDLMELDNILPTDKQFDICIFKGIFYHLPNPVAGLKLVADRTREVIVVDSDMASHQPDGYLKFIAEGVENPLSGVHQIAWAPTGPQVIKDILHLLGFTTAKTVMWWSPDKDAKPGAHGRVRVVASRKPELLAHIETLTEPTITRPAQ